jgi:hypothetical protein
MGCLTIDGAEIEPAGRAHYRVKACSQARMLEQLNRVAKYISVVFIDGHERATLID